MATITATRRAATASAVDTVRVGLRVLLPLIAQGAVIRRPVLTRLAALTGADQGVIDVLDDLRRRYGEGPLLLRLAGRRAVLPLAREDVGRVLASSPTPFTPASWEKRAALRHFQPDGVLISTGPERDRRRPFNEQVLDLGQAMHHLAAPITGVIEEEVGELLADGQPILDWPRFSRAHARMVRRVVLGDRARDDVRITQRLDGLRRRANWSYLAPRARRRRGGFQAHLDRYLTSAEPGSLAAVIAATAAAPEVEPYGQVPHWMFAFDAVGASVFRALAALAADHGTRSTVEGERHTRVAVRPRLSAAVLEAVRLWPTTLVILRDTTAELRWGDAAVPPGSAVVIVSLFFHRDPGTVAAANQLDLNSWLDGTFDNDPGIVPFSAGPVRCAGRDLVTFIGSTTLAAVLARHDLTLVRPRLDPEALPASLDHFRIRFRVWPRGLGAAR